MECLEPEAEDEVPPEAKVAPHPAPTLLMRHHRAGPASELAGSFKSARRPRQGVTDCCGDACPIEQSKPEETDWQAVAPERSRARSDAAACPSASERWLPRAVASTSDPVAAAGTKARSEATDQEVRNLSSVVSAPSLVPGRGVWRFSQRLAWVMLSPTLHRRLRMMLIGYILINSVASMATAVQAFWSTQGQTTHKDCARSHLYWTEHNQARLTHAGGDRVFKIILVLSFLQLLISTPISIFLISKAASAHLVWVATYAWIVWLQNRLYNTMYAFEVRGHCMWMRVYAILGVVSSWAFMFVTPVLVWRSIHALESALVKKVGSRKLLVALVLQAVVFIVHISLLYYEKVTEGHTEIYEHDDHLDYIRDSLDWVLVFCSQAFFSIAIRALISTVRRLTRLVEQLGQHGSQELLDAKQARSACRNLLVGLMITYSTTGIRWVVWAMWHQLWPLETNPLEYIADDEVLLQVVFVVLPAMVDEWGNLLAALFFSGLFTGALESTAKERDAEECRRAKRKLACDAYRHSDDPRWKKKVEDLAYRGLTLESLLRFYRSLPKHMPHFDPMLSTTNDVVREAIIPLSSERESAMSTIMMKGVPTRPKVMISHHWMNLFLDLFSAVVADALGDHAYAWSVHMLIDDLDGLEERLRWAGKLHNTYWICAFSVNQHSGICGTVRPAELDQVTGLLPPPCTCSAAKYFNSCRPRRADGKSIYCELNKFDCMMAFLATTDPDFTHTIAVDRKFEVFTRAWVMAEVATSFDFGVVQHLKLFDVASLRLHEGSLRQLRIQDMKASRPEDVDEILAQIADTDSFNSRMQKLLFEDLIPSWNSFDLTAKLRRTGQLVRMDSWLTRNPVLTPKMEQAPVDP